VRQLVVVHGANNNH